MEKIINIFGDSIVWGAYDEMGGWVDRLKNDLMKDKENYFEVYNLGITGGNTEELLKRFEIENEARNPNVIIIAIGTNDAAYLNSGKDNFVPVGKFKSNLEKIINQSRNFDAEIILIGLTNVDDNKVNPVPWATDFHYNNDNIVKYNDALKEICEKNNVLFMEMMDLLNEKDLEDGLHPNSEGHEKMFLRIRDFLVENNVMQISSSPQRTR